jgi:hypothetical protein
MMTRKQAAAAKAEVKYLTKELIAILDLFLRAKGPNAVAAEELSEMASEKAREIADLF